MLEKPAIADERLIETVRRGFGVDLAAVTFLPIGADVNTAVYRGEKTDGSTLFIKLRRGDATGLSVKIPQALHDQGFAEIIAPIEMLDGKLWTKLDDFLVILSPYVNGSNGFEQDLFAEQWTALGRALRGIHDARLPDDIIENLPREDFSDEWRELVRAFQLQSNRPDFVDDAAEEMAQIMREHEAAVTQLLVHAQQLGDMLRAEELGFVPCHADIHAGNVLIDEAGKLYIVDWDTFMLAPKERDLMFIGGGIGDSWRGEHTERPFFAGYGPVEIDWSIIAYYRCERIIQDIAEFGKYLLSPQGGADRAQAVHYLASNFQPGSTLDIALASVEKADQA